MRSLMVLQTLFERQVFLVGIYVTDELHREVWQGGYSFHSRGNNFLAELAAAATVLNGIPAGSSITLHLDSVAAIQAIQKGVLLSERRRIRNPGRIWMNWARAGLPNENLRFAHVRSHTGSREPTSVGNQKADDLANAFRRLGERKPEVNIPLNWEEHFFLQDPDGVVQGDVRDWSKKTEEKELLKRWLDKCGEQCSWIRTNETQIRRMSNEVWKWSVESGEGDAWIYFIFGVANWLPTRGRTGGRGRHDHNLRHLLLCPLCSSGEVEDFSHFIRCPALKSELEKANAHIQSCLQEWGLVPPLPQMSTGAALREKWLDYAQRDFVVSRRLRIDALKRFIDSWIRAQGTRSSYRSFSMALSDRLTNMECKCISHHTCVLDSRWVCPRSLQSILAEELCLGIEGLTDLLHHSPSFGTWWSEDEADKAFGVKTNFLQQSCVGKNIFFVSARSADVNLCAGKDFG